MISSVKPALLACTTLTFIAAPAVATAQSAPLPAPAPTPVPAPPQTTPEANSSATPSTPAEQNPVATEGDIIVTAQRRDESLSRTPVSVAVVSGEALGRAQIVSESDLRFATPGLQVRTGQNSNQINYSLRGQSQDPYSESRPGVLPYFNEIQISSIAGASTFYDLQSVQVLKGPQGTLFGRSATGGAILFTSAKPTEEFGGYISGLYGNYDSKKIEGAINIPLSTDQLLLRVAGFYRDRNGFQRNLYDGGREGDQKQYGGRASLTMRFGPSVQNDLVVDYLKADSENTFAVISGLLPYTGQGAPFVPATLLYAGNRTPTAAITGQCTIQAFARIPGACPPVNPLVSGFYSAYYSDPRRPAGGLQQVLADQQARGPFVVDADAANTYRTENVVVTNATTFDVGADTRIKNIVGYVDVRNFQQFDADGTPFGLSQSDVKGGSRGNHVNVTQFSDELQLLGKALGGNLDYVIGGYYSSEKTTTIRATSFFDIVLGGQLQNNNTRISNTTYAGYAQGTYKFGDSGFSATGGLRYTSEKVRKETLNGDTFLVALGDPPPPGYSYDKSRTFNRWSWTLGLQYQATDSLLLYLANHRAYKNGGFNATLAPLNGNAATAGDSYEAERVTDAEAGAKFSGYVGGMRVRTNAALFYNWIVNGQRAAFALVNGGPASLTVNVPKGKTYGLEYDLQVQPASWLSVGGNFNYTRAEFTDGLVNVVGNVQRYDRVPDTPRYNATGFADITVPLTSDLTGLAHGDVYYQSESFTSPRSANNAGTRVIPYTTANFRLGVESRAGGWSLTANLKNAFNKVFYTGGLQVGEIYQVNTLVPGDPRTVTVEARIKF